MVERTLILQFQVRKIVAQYPWVRVVTVEIGAPTTGFARLGAYLADPSQLFCLRIPKIVTRSPLTSDRDVGNVVFVAVNPLAEVGDPLVDFALSRDETLS